MSFKFCIPCGSDCCKTSPGGPQPQKKYSSGQLDNIPAIFKPIRVDSPAALLRGRGPRCASPEDSLISDLDTLKNSQNIDRFSELSQKTSKSSYSISSLYAYDINDEELVRPLLGRTESEYFLGDVYDDNGENLNGNVSANAVLQQGYWTPETPSKSLEYLQLNLRHVDSETSSEISSIRNFEKNKLPVIVSSLEQGNTEPSYKTVVNIEITPNGRHIGQGQTPDTGQMTKFPKYKGMQAQTDYKWSIFRALKESKPKLTPTNENEKLSDSTTITVKESSEINTNLPNSNLSVSPVVQNVNNNLLSSPAGSDMYFSNSPSPNLSFLSNGIRCSPNEIDSGQEAEATDYRAIHNVTPIHEEKVPDGEFKDQIATLTRQFQKQVVELRESSPLFESGSTAGEPETKQIIPQCTESYSDPDYMELMSYQRQYRMRDRSRSHSHESSEPIPGPSRIFYPTPVRELPLPPINETSFINPATPGTSHGPNGNIKANDIVNNNKVRPKLELPNSEEIVQAERIVEHQQEVRRRRKGEKKLSVQDNQHSIPVLVPASSDPLNDYLQRPVPDHIYEDPFLPTERVISNLDRQSLDATALTDSLQRLQEYVNSHEGFACFDELAAVISLVESQQFRKALVIQNTIHKLWCSTTPPIPNCSNLQELIHEVTPTLYNSTLKTRQESFELLNLLNNVNMQFLELSHDLIAKNELCELISEGTPSAPPENIALTSSRPTESYLTPADRIKLVQIEKTNEPLGVTILNEGDKIVVGRIITGGIIGSSGLLREGDEILEINEIRMTGKSINEVCDVLADMTGTLTFRVASSSTPRNVEIENQMSVPLKAMFNYDPEDDLFIPCRELGIHFVKSDILYVINQDDANWWQAHREGQEDTLAGLIPSKSFQEQREKLTRRRSLGTENPNGGSRVQTSTRTLSALAKADKNLRKNKFARSMPSFVEGDFIIYSGLQSGIEPSDEIPTYEEVTVYYPCTFKRPIILIGPSNIGRHELSQMLLRDSSRFASPVAHTSRPPKPGEKNGVDYNFISRSQFESDILDRKFIEHGEYEKKYYGKSFSSVKAVIDQDKICVLNLHPESIHAIRTNEFRPYVVFITPPSLQRLKQVRLLKGQPCQEEDLLALIESAYQMEEKYGHYFDSVIINTDLKITYQSLLRRINIIESEPQWVPKAWIKRTRKNVQ